MHPGSHSYFAYARSTGQVFTLHSGAARCDPAPALRAARRAQVFVPAAHPPAPRPPRACAPFSPAPPAENNPGTLVQEPLSPEQQQQAFLSRLMLMLGSFVTLCLLLF